MNLLPCPFCGGKAIIRTWKSKYPQRCAEHYGQCLSCRTELKGQPSEQEAVSAWNHRIGKENNMESTEHKYFVSYAAYIHGTKDFFNDMLYIDTEITMDLISEIEDSLLKKINDGCDKEHKLYYAVQIININRI